MTEYSHEAWLAGLTLRTSLLQGDAEAIDAIRTETREYHKADDITDDAPVFLWNGLYVKGLGAKQYEVADHTRRRYVVPQGFPKDPIAVMPGAAEAAAAAAEPVPVAETRRDELMASSAPVEGSDLAIAEAKNRIRLYHEIPTALFPEDGELRWFINGIHLVGPGDDPSVFQAPMKRLEDMVVAREHPQLPRLRDPKPTA